MELGKLIAREMNVGVMLVEHRLELLSAIADRVVVLDLGKLIAEGDPERVFEDPRVQKDLVVELDHPNAGKFKVVTNPIRLSDTPTSISRPPPTLGQHTDEVLREFGLVSQDAAALGTE